MHPARLLLVLILAAVGVVWIGQGLNVIKGSAMTGAPVWAVIGAALIVVAAFVFRSGWQHRKTS